MAIKIINNYNIEIERHYWIFNRRNINRIAREYDARVICWEPETKQARLRDSRGRLIFCEGYRDATEGRA